MDREFFAAMFALLGAAFGFILLFFAFVLAISELHGRHTCTNYQEITGKQTRWVALDVCYVNHNDEWIRYPDYQKVILARDGLSGVTQ